MEANIYGLKCDNPDCDFVDMSIEYEDYKNWVNKPCPKCGAILLTKFDYEICKQAKMFAKVCNILIPWQRNIKTHKRNIHLHGNDTVEYGKVEEIK